uniref:Uncharacterized protein n=1 Tax=Chromera velia CCMP2878 TaxID=1169474 RepID=A0A0G4HCI4_9ALVE|eukprot:Cvel_6333.t1-p1 / transcript=Cvel_6333.t1 / gene=Cvel_6333 / organism=Chromera_velia_CCMP2878 / gene_product=hypothetical protein / transcript_product=hypothetical protein / location=Cvel_scaffold307:64574-67114(+) / protein_length=160 / sequence_SO=supercontig / SO=protein_coding / is_pseudo=false
MLADDHEASGSDDEEPTPVDGTDDVSFAQNGGGGGKGKKCCPSPGSGLAKVCCKGAEGEMCPFGSFPTEKGIDGENDKELPECPKLCCCKKDPDGKKGARKCCKGTSPDDGCPVSHAFNDKSWPPSKVEDPKFLTGMSFFDRCVDKIRGGLKEDEEFQNC